METLLSKVLVVIGLVVCFGFVIFAFANKIKAFFKARFAKMSYKVKYCVFLFRWFLIGKYHCEFKGKCSRVLFASLHKAFWLFVIFSCTMSLAACIYVITGAR